MSSAAEFLVSEALGNTPAVCRASYIDPRVLDRYRDGTTIKPAPSSLGRMTAKQRLKIEREVLGLVA
jgi:DNA topoisomerase I